MFEDDEKFKSLIHNAKILDLNVNEIKVLYCIQKSGRISQRDIERQADLRQPEVSLAIKQLALTGMLHNESMPNPGKGRPFNCYTLKKPITEYFSAIKNAKEAEWSTARRALESLIKQFSD